ncbi:hypothetical protein SESBI_49099 [Sesbania bispinosa]|nr:hypothetical protein SESBI_49099 [Sesbania bispinosa]
MVQPLSHPNGDPSLTLSLSSFHFPSHRPRPLDHPWSHRPYSLATPSPFCLSRRLVTGTWKETSSAERQHLPVVV